MNMNTNNPTPFLSRWMRSVGALLFAGVTAALLFAIIFNGCKEDDPGVINVCIPPMVIRTSPMDSASNVPLHKTGSLTQTTTAAGVKVITATFSRPMNPKTINSSTFILQQGTLFITGSVSYSDTTAVFIAPNGLGPNRTYTCTLTTGITDVVGTPLASNYVWIFTTSTPVTPSLVAPVNFAVDQATNPTLIWNSVPEADTYRLQVSTTNNFATTFYDDSTLTLTSQQLTGLSAGTTYYWRVNAKVSGGTSYYSSIWRFTTITSSIAPVLLSPDSLAQNQATNLTLSWLSSLGADTYRLQISTTNNFATTVFNDSTNTGTSQLISGLTVGTTYYWRVNAKNTTGTSAYSHIWSFTTIAPGTPTLVTPVDGAVNQATNPILVWNVVPGANSYRLQVSTTSNFATTVYNDSTRTSTAQQISGLAVGTTYFWRVNSKISGGTSSYSTVWSFTVFGSPSTPVLLSPVDLAPNQATSLTLSWLTSTGANTYRLQVSTTNNFASTVIDDSVNTSTSQPITGLTVGTTYFWRVNAKNIAGTSSYSTVWRFTTIAPGTPTLVAPLDGSVNQAMNPTLIWNAVPNATSYRLEVSTTNNFATTFYDDSTLTNTSQAMSGLAVGTTYYWRVNSKISGVTSAYSNVWSFTTIASPSTPVLLAPGDSTQNLATGLTLSWLTSVGANTYRLQVSTTSNFATTVINDSTNTSTSKPITGLAIGTTYFWRVNAKNVAGTSSYSTVWRFSTIAAGTPTLVAPLNESSNQSSNPTFIWNAVPGADTYRLEVSTTSNFATTFYNDSTITNSSQFVSGLAVGTLYFWRVNSKISGGTSAYSDVWSFTTLSPPSAPNLLAPVDSMLNVPTSLTLSWNASEGASTYRLQVSTSSNFATTLINDSTNTGTSQPLTGLNVGTTYYWRVNAKNIAGTSSYSNVWRFTTLAPGTPTLLAPLNEASDQPTDPTLIWNSVPSAESYRLQVSLVSNFSTTVYDDSTRTNTSQVVSGLGVGTTYYWRVNSKISGGTSAYSDVWSFTTYTRPAPPVLVSPIDSAKNQATSLTLSWLASMGADTYRLEVDTSSNFTTMVYNDSLSTGTSKSMTGLNVGTTYFWRVNAKNSAGTSAYSTVWRFTTIAPGTPTLVAPLNEAIDITTNPTLIWNSLPAAETYRLQVSLLPNFVTIAFDDSTLTNTSQMVSGLGVGTTYYWRVNSKISGSTSAYSDVWSFTTYTRPAPPVLVSPVDSAKNQATSLTLSWLASMGADTYRLEVDTNSNFATMVYNDSLGTGTSKSMTGLNVGTTYFWRVNAKNSAGTSAYSTVWRFTTIAPGTPTLVSPLNGAVDEATNLTLIWNSMPAAETYRLQVSLVPTFATLAYDDSTLTNTSQLVSDLGVGTTYYWRVNSKISGSTSVYSDVWSFTTSTRPAPPVLFSPVDSAKNQATTLTLSWLASSGADTYRLEVDTSSNFTTMLYDDSTNTGTSHIISGLEVGKTYYWRVNAKNTVGTSSYSTVWRFTTSAAALNPPTLVAPLDASTFLPRNPTLSWNASSGAITYRLQVDTSTVFASTVFDDSTLTGLSQPMVGLTYGMTYYWRVNAKNADGTSMYSMIWRFTVEPPPPPPIPLGPAERFGSFGGPAGVTNEGILTQIFGSIGTTGASTLITGFHDGTAPPSNVFTETPLNKGAVRDTIYTATAPAGSVAGQDATQSLAGAQTAFNYLNGLPPGADPGAGELGGLTLYKGTYTSAGGTFKITSVDLTLDAQGDSNAQFIFQSASSLTVGAAGPAGARSVILINGAQAKNVFWAVGAAATINAAGGGTMVGTIIAYSGVTFSTHDNVVITRLEGRALGLNASVTMVNTIINVPLP